MVNDVPVNTVSTGSLSMLSLQLYVDIEIASKMLTLRDVNEPKHSGAQLGKGLTVTLVQSKEHNSQKKQMSVG